MLHFAGPLDAITFDHQRVEGMVDFLNKSINALKRVRDLPILWSPYWQVRALTCDNQLSVADLFMR